MSIFNIKSNIYHVALMLTFCFYMTLKLASDRYSSTYAEQGIKPMCLERGTVIREEFLLYFTSDCLCTTVHLSWVSGSQLPEIQSLENSTFSLQNKGCTVIHTSLQVILYEQQNCFLPISDRTLNVPSTARASMGRKERLIFQPSSLATTTTRKLK